MLAAIGFIGLTAAPSAGESSPRQLPMAEPATVGVDPQRLGYLERYIEKAVHNKDIPGAVLLVSRNGRVVLHEAYGIRDPASGELMQKDAVFRIYSMSKALTAAAGLRLIERGALAMNGRLSDYLPDFADLRVLKTDQFDFRTDALATVEADAPITIADLLRQSTGFAGNNFYPGYAGSLFRKAGIESDTLTLAEAAERTAKIPLVYQPGTTFSYAETNYNVLGRLLELSENKPIADVMQAEIFGPLEMIDSGFEVPLDKADRLAQPFNKGTASEDGLFDPTKPRKFHPPANGIVSTAADYWHFVQMLLDNGRGPDGSVLAPSTVDAMLSDNTSTLKPGSADPMHLFQGWNWGLGLGVHDTDAPSFILAGRGQFGWVGAGSTMFIADRGRNLAGIIMLQQPEFLHGHVATLMTLVLQTATD